MTVKSQNFEIFAGDSKQIEILVTDEDTDLPVDLTPYLSGTIIWVVYDKSTKNLILSKSLGSGVTVPSPSSGIVIITLSPTDTENITPKLYNHECEISSSPTDVATVTTGTINILYSKA